MIPGVEDEAMRFATRVLVPSMALVFSSVVVACLWDHDTIKMERARFPETLELITGKFLRHSPEFYEWRIKDRLKRLETDPRNVALLDDLAVAYDKTGRHDLAIETARMTEKIQPGRYETAANLGTFHFHAGKLGEGIPHIERALKINPNAHFGREKFQKALVEYVLKRRKAGATLPLAHVTLYDTPHSPGSAFAQQATISLSFFDHLWPKALEDGRLRVGQDEITAAINGVLGMMKFGKHDTPVLLEALGSLLAQRNLQLHGDAKLLACRAYLKASYEAPDDKTRAAYRGMAASILKLQTPEGAETQIEPEQVEAEFKKELDEAKAWYAELHEREKSWIREGKDADSEFDKLYDQIPPISGYVAAETLAAEERWQEFSNLGVKFGIPAFILMAICWFVYSHRKRE